jgi:hypothetical protein
MGGKSKNLGLLVLVGLLAVVVAACGGGSSSSSTDSAEAEPAKAFIVKGEANNFVIFGHESGAVDREAASKVLGENLEAREAHDWAGQCATLSRRTVKEVEHEAEFIAGHRRPCPQELAKLAETAPPYVLADTLSGPIAALRIEGNKGIALYHGENKNYAMPMKKEGGEWKVDKLTTLPLKKPSS